MKRSELEHVIRAAGAIAGAKELIIIGSQAILSSYPNAPDELTISMEADVYPLNDPEKSDLIDGTIGELSPFHEQFGYYAHGVGPETACFPADWRERAVKVTNNNTGGVTGICPSPVDLAVSKIAAGRDKDFAFVATMLKNNMISLDELERLISFLPESRNKTVKQNFNIFRNTSMPAEL
jgi:hypothetical protein